MLPTLAAKRGPATVIMYLTPPEEKPAAAWFTMTDFCAVSQLTPGGFLEYDQLMPRNCPTIVRFARRQLQIAINLTRPLWHGLGPQTITFTARNQYLRLQVGNQNEVALPAEIEGPDTQVAMNARWVLDALTHSPETVIWAINGPDKPVRWDGDNVTHVLWPVHLGR